MIYNDLKLIMPDNHTDEQQSITTIDKYSSDQTILPQANCNTTHEGQYFGSALELQVADDARSTTRVDSVQYTITCDSHSATCSIDDKRVDEYVTTNESVLPIVLAAETHSPSHVQDAINYFENEHKASESRSEESTSRIDTHEHDTLSSERMNTSTAEVMHMIGAVNSTYINVVHDCEKVCVTSEINHIPATDIRQRIQRDGLLCVQRIDGANTAELTTNAHLSSASQTKQKGIRRTHTKIINMPIATNVKEPTIIPTIMVISIVGVMGILLAIYMFITDFPAARGIHESISRTIRNLRRTKDTKETRERISDVVIEDTEAQAHDAEYIFARTQCVVDSKENTEQSDECIALTEESETQL